MNFYIEPGTEAKSLKLFPWRTPYESNNPWYYRKVC